MSDLVQEAYQKWKNLKSKHDEISRKVNRLDEAIKTLSVQEDAVVTAGIKAEKNICNGIEWKGNSRKKFDEELRQCCTSIKNQGKESSMC